MYIIACEYKLTLTIFCDTFHLAKMYNEDETKKKNNNNNKPQHQPTKNKQTSPTTTTPTSNPYDCNRSLLQ